MNFWKLLPRPFFALAPMEDVTDTVFREVILSVSSPENLHVVFTEFMSVDGFLHPAGHDSVRHRMYISRQEREILREKGVRIVAQIWGSDPEKFHKVAGILSSEYEFDGIDINMGCPVSKIIRNKACSALINFPQLAREIIMATRDGSNLAVSVKTRIGFNEINTLEWISNLLEAEPAAITIHGRTQKMQSNGTADWDEIRKAVSLRDELGKETVIIGNGDAESFRDGLEKAGSARTEGIMVGRGIFNNPAFFSEDEGLDLDQRLYLLKKHITRFSEEWGTTKNPAILKRFYKIYVNSFENASEFRRILMNTKGFEEAMDIIREFENQLYVNERVSPAFY